MFDILVSTPKKRLICGLCFLSFCFEICVLSDLHFFIQILNSNGFSELLQLENSNSFFAYFYFSVLQSGILSQNMSLFTVLNYIFLFFRSLTLWHWILILGLAFLLISHRSYLAKVTMCLLAFYLVSQLLMLGGTSFSLIQAVNTNNANLALARINTCALVLFIGQAILLIVNTLWLVKLIVKEYLPLFA